MNFAFDTAPIVARLREHATTLRLVDTSAGIDAAMANTSGAVPAAFVVLNSERSAPHAGGAGMLIQTTMVYVSVVLCVRNYRAANTGGAANDDLVPVRRDVAAALLNWMPPGAQWVFDHDSGRLENYTAGNLWWQDVYRTRMTNEVRQ